MTRAWSVEIASRRGLRTQLLKLGLFVCDVCVMVGAEDGWCGSTCSVCRAKKVLDRVSNPRGGEVNMSCM